MTPTVQTCDRRPPDELSAYGHSTWLLASVGAGQASHSLREARRARISLKADHLSDRISNSLSDRREWCSPPHPGYAAVIVRRSRNGVFQPTTRWSSRPIGRFGCYIRPRVTAVLCLTCQATVCGVASVKHTIGVARAIYSAFEGEDSGPRGCNGGSKQQDGDQWHEPGSLHEAILPICVSPRNLSPEPPIQREANRLTEVLALVQTEAQASWQNV